MLSSRAASAVRLPRSASCERSGSAGSGTGVRHALRLSRNGRRDTRIRASAGDTAHRPGAGSETDCGRSALGASSYGEVRPWRDKPDINTSLKKNSIYGVDLDGVRVACKVKVRPPKPPLQDAKLAGYGKKLVGCLMKSFGKPLAAQGIRAQHPENQGVPPHDQDTVRAVRPAGCAGVLLFGHPDHLLAGEC